jgi:hypothetical protein
MARNYALDPTHRDERRRRVEYLKIRGLTNREIVKALEEEGYMNPGTMQPYGRDAINKDVLWLRGEWAKRHEKVIKKHISRQLAEIHELKRAAWAADDFAEVRHCLKREAELLGLDAPRERRLAGPQGGAMQVEDVTPKAEAAQIREIDEHLVSLEAERMGLEVELNRMKAEEESDGAALT